jgi:alpha-mannosidase
MLIPKVEQKIDQYLRFLKGKRYREIAPLSFETFETDKTFRVPPEDTIWEKITTPYEYGKPWHTQWFRTVYKAPAKNTYPLYLRAVPNADSLIFLDAETVGAFNPDHKKIKVTADGKTHTLHIESYSGHYFPGCPPMPLPGRQVMLTISRQIHDYPNVFEGGVLVERVEPIYGLYYDALCLFELAKILDDDSLRKARIIRGLYDALTHIHFSSDYTDMELEKESQVIRKTLAPLLAAKNNSTVPEIHLVGHAHIDHAWLWHIGETERKVARTFMNMCALAKEYPDFVFIQPQPAQLTIVKNNYPVIFQAVQEAFKNGNWDPNGGMWVEADCNITGGESLVRQFLVGKQATKEMLNYESDTLWLPDVFGYAAALPEILAGCRIKYFVTNKIDENDTTRFPYDTFIWRGLDGTPIKAHFIHSKHKYNGRVSPDALADVWIRVQHKEIQSGAIASIGEGDGGGGTSRSDLEMAKRLRNLEGTPKSRWRKVSEALDRIFGEENAWPEWHGELYLELHRGTYTTQARTKRNNRKNEFALRNVEWLYAIADLEGLAAYPKETLLEGWKALLTLQFHDIIPGSSINRVYAEADIMHQQISSDMARLSSVICRKIVDQFGGFIVFNGLSWERFDPVVMGGAAVLAFGKAVALKASAVVASFLTSDRVFHKGPAGIYPVQYYRDINDKDAVVFCPRLPSMGWSRFEPLSVKEACALEGFVSSSPFTYDKKAGSLRTPFYRIKFDKANRIISLVDVKARLQMVAKDGCFNGFISAQDMPVFWDAWDLDSDWTRYIREETKLLSLEVVADGPVCIIIRQKYAIAEASMLVQDMIFYAEEKRIDFVTKIDWKESHRLLKVSFNTAINTNQVRCEVQYGHLLRNTHKNLPQDRAKFEICAHKWICLEEEGAGFALLNDCKYGHDVSGGSLRLTLLRSPKAPDENSDMGEHRFTYSIVPFTEPFGSAGIVRKGYELNDSVLIEASLSPGKARLVKPEDAEYSLFSLDGKAVIAESIKAPENGKKKTVVIRLYESLGGRAKTVLRFSKDIVAVAMTDMLEDNPVNLRYTGKDIPLSFRAFEIKTLMVALI